MNTWIKNELKVLRKYDKLRNEYAACPDIMKDYYMVCEILLLEAKLIIIDKPVIGFFDSKFIGIYSFKEALQLEDDYLSNGKIFMYFPINFTNVKDFSKFLG